MRCTTHTHVFEPHPRLVGDWYCRVTGCGFRIPHTLLEAAERAGAIVVRDVDEENDGPKSWR